MFRIVASSTNIPGGLVSSENNLSHIGDCWIDFNACVIGNAHISEDAFVLDNSIVSGTALIAGNAIISGKSDISNVCIYDTMKLHSCTVKSESEFKPIRRKGYYILCTPVVIMVDYVRICRSKFNLKYFEELNEFKDKDEILEILYENSNFLQ